NPYPLTPAPPYGRLCERRDPALREPRRAIEFAQQQALWSAALTPPLRRRRRGREKKPPPKSPALWPGISARAVSVRYGRVVPCSTGSSSSFMPYRQGLGADASKS